MADTDGPWVWVFNAVGAMFPCGVFTSVAQAEQAIAAWKLSGTLTQYHVGELSYQWDVDRGLYRVPLSGRQVDTDLVSRYVSSYWEHYHYEDGVAC